MKRLLIVAALGLLAMNAQDYINPPEKVEVAVVVEPGDTLWNLVGDAMKKTGDDRYFLEVLTETKKRNGFTGDEAGNLQIGEKIIIPCEVRR